MAIDISDPGADAGALRKALAAALGIWPNVPALLVHPAAHAPGTMLIVAGLARYRVTTTGAADHHLTTAAGAALAVLPEPFGYDVRAFGAVGDGVTNDTAAIQAAIDAAGRAGRGVVFMPAGTYIVQPPDLHTGHALAIDFDNVTLQGAGAEATRLSFHLHDGSDPAANWPIATEGRQAGRVLRGHGIRIAQSTGDIRRGVRLADFELDGNTHTTGNKRFPASPNTGDGWDLSNKGIFFEIGKRFDRIEIARCHIHGFRGEIVYYGGSQLNDVRVVDCRIGDTNADGLSFSSQGHCEVRGNTIYACTHAAIENAYFGGVHRYLDNVAMDCLGVGFDIFPGSEAGPWAHVDIVGNTFLRCGTAAVNYAAVRTVGPKNMRILSNRFVDCERIGVNVNAVGRGGSNRRDVRIVLDGCEIAHNTFVADEGGFDSCIWIGSRNPETAPDNLLVHDNVGYRTREGKARGVRIRQMVNPAEKGRLLVLGKNCVIERNYLNEGDQEGHGDARAVEQLLTTRRRRIAAAGGRRVMMMKARVVWRVVDAPTEVSIIVSMRDPARAEHEIEVASGVYEPGMYSAEQIGMTGDYYGGMGVFARAGSPDTVYVSAEITGM